MSPSFFPPPFLASSASSSLANAPVEAEQAWPQSSGEEELQLQLALAMSKEEAEQVSAKVNLSLGVLGLAGGIGDYGGGCKVEASQVGCTPIHPITELVLGIQALKSPVFRISYCIEACPPGELRRSPSEV